MSSHPDFEVIRPDLLEGQHGLTPQISEKIGAITVFAANIEFRLEFAIWRLQGHSPKGEKHTTDAQPIGVLIGMFEAEVAKLPDRPAKHLAELWCKTARTAFEFRHSIAHGAAFREWGAASFHRNRSWYGEIRKRPEASLSGDLQTFENIYLTFALLLRVINGFSNTKRPIETIGTPEHIKAMRSVYLLMDEMASGHGPWFEKF
ncbi:hypothetical protein JHL21_11410 [Devosia sp. WQ 349]|uniref:hypothetical protein n=1 Tax=Devosia sp. WQ 349K1 TaxID=2800329 RepID=UPI001903EA5A|nr:hypothetical protein [Devosia sp. WQ 349K1]MBK1795106.1 hypothetical protein [Devosia sp. WQ 349K1]